MRHITLLLYLVPNGQNSSAAGKDSAAAPLSLVFALTGY